MAGRAAMPPHRTRKRPAEMPMPEPDALRFTPPKRLKPFGVLVLLLAVCVIVAGLLDRLRASQHLAAATATEAVPTVDIVQPGMSSQRVLVLPGDIRAF